MQHNHSWKCHEYDESEQISVTEKCPPSEQSNEKHSDFICFQNYKHIMFLSELKPSAVSEGTKIINEFEVQSSIK